LNLDKIARKKEIRMTAPGRKSGQPRSVTIWFVRDDQAIGLGTLDDTRGWVKNALAADQVELEVDSCRMRGKIRVVEDPVVHRRLRKAFARKYLPARLLSLVGVGQKTTFLVEELEEWGAV
jgi:hypothetical protein